MSVGTRLRFEILKRDGFRCRYCGATAAQTMLHVDHVLALSEGGADDPANLVAACSGCNLGKSNKPIDALDAKRVGTGASTDAVIEHAAQVRAYLGATREVEAARDETVAWLTEEWGRRIGYTPPKNAAQILRAALLAHPTEHVLRAFDATGSHADRLDTNLRVITYFRACLKNMRTETPASVAGRAVFKALDDYRHNAVLMLAERLGLDEHAVYGALDPPDESLEMTLSGPLPDDERAAFLEARAIARSAR
jgi:hypothetical protein